MTRTATPHAPAFASASNISTADELLGRLIACRPIEDRMFDTKVGSSTATVCQVVTVDDDGTPDDLGERPIFWQVVRRQLTAATEATPWIAGRLVQVGQAYKLDSLTDRDAGLVACAAGLPAHRRRGQLIPAVGRREATSRWPTARLHSSGRKEATPCPHRNGHPRSPARPATPGCAPSNRTPATECWTP